MITSVVSVSGLVCRTLKYITDILGIYLIDDTDIHVITRGTNLLRQVQHLHELLNCNLLSSKWQGFRDTSGFELATIGSALSWRN